MFNDRGIESYRDTQSSNSRFAIDNSRLKPRLTIDLCFVFVCEGGVFPVFILVHLRVSVVILRQAQDDNHRGTENTEIHGMYHSPFTTHYILTVTLKKVAGIEVLFGSALLFCAMNNCSSSLCNSAALPFLFAASKAFIVGP